MNWQFFTLDSYESLDELRAAFKKLCFVYHPDKHPSDKAEQYTKLFQAMIAEYELLLNVFVPKANASEQARAKADPKYYAKTFTFEQESELGQMLSKLMNFKGLIIDICGTWIWLSGKTKENKDGIHALNFRYQGAKQMWYWTPYQTKFYRRKVLSMDEIYEKYGKHTIEVGETEMLSA